MLTLFDFAVELFTLVDSNGAAVEGEELGLLLYKGGTVCDDRFNITAAEAICKQLQFDGAKEWTIAERFDIQTDYDINLSNVECSSEEWESCTFTKGDICSHREDVFLSCRHANSSGKRKRCLSDVRKDDEMNNEFTEKKETSFPFYKL